MATDFLHGVEVITADTGPRPIETIRSAVIGLIGTAPAADDDKFPLDTPVLVNTRGGFAGIGAGGTLPAALAGIFDQASPFVVVIRVDAGSSASEALANVIGGVDGTTGARTGISAFRDSQTVAGVTPMILVAPGFTSARPIGLTGVTVSNQGSAYTTVPAVVFSGGGSDAGKVLPTAHAVLGTGGNAGKVASVVIDTAGRNMSSAPTIAFTGGGGTAAAATAVTDKVANPVVNALRSVAMTLRAHCIVGGPNTTDADAIAYRNDFGDRRVFIVDPFIKVWSAEDEDYVAEDPAARIAGLIAQVDAKEGFHVSPSNHEVIGIGGLSRPVDYSLGDPSTRANLLNSNSIATFIRDEGWRLWGNRTAASDPIWAFLSVSRTADMIDLSIQSAHRWACDRNINRGYVESVVASVNSYLRQLKARGAILGGNCWFDPDLNSTAEITAGHVTFSYDFTAPSPAERITFRSIITDTYVASLFSAQQ
jgi:phage tail sheath protein FI